MIARPLALLTATLVAACTLHAQTPVLSLRTEGVIGVFAGNSFRSSGNRQSIAKQLELRDRYLRGSRVLASAHSLATRQTLGATFEVDAQSLGLGASAGTTASRSGTHGSQRYGIELRAAHAQGVDVVCRYRGVVDGFAMASGKLTSSVGSRDLTADGVLRTFTLANVAVRSFTQTLQVALDAQCAASSASRVRWEVAIEIHPVTRCQVSFGTRSCDGAGTLGAQILGTHANGDTILAFETRTPSSTRPTVVSLFVSPSGQTASNLIGFLSPSCVVLTTSPISLAAAFARNGETRMLVAIPRSVQGALWFQSLFARPFSIGRLLGTTNTLQVDAR